MKKFDLWGDCPFWPAHQFKNSICIGCGLKKPQKPSLINQIRSEKLTLEQKVNRIIQYQEEVSEFEYAWNDTVTILDAYGKGGSGHFGKEKLRVIPSAPLPNEKKRAKTRLNRVARVIRFYGKYWPSMKSDLDTIFAREPTAIHIRTRVECFLGSLMFFEIALTRNQIEELVAAFSYYYSRSSERRIAEEPNSQFPEITRKTLRKWVKFVEKFEEAKWGNFAS